MINKVFRYSKKNGATGGMDYLMGNKNRSIAPIMLRGNEAITRELLASATGKRQYTAGVCSFAELESSFDHDFKNEVMDLYEQTLMAGFPADHYCMDWIEHTDKGGRLELNWHIVNQDLVTGRVLQPYWHKQDLSRLDLAKKIINDKFNLHSPDDPQNFRDATTLNNFGDRADIQERINRQIGAAIESEKILNRQDIIDSLNETEWLDVSRITKNSISIKITNNDEIKKPIRLQGGIYSDKFNAGLDCYVQAKEDSARQFNAQRQQRIIENTKKLEKLNRAVAEKRNKLLTIPEKNLRNDQKAKLAIKRESEAFELQKQKTATVYAPNCVTPSTDFSGIGDWNLGRNTVVTKKEILNKITTENDRYNKSIDRSRTGYINAIREQQQRAINITKSFIKHVQAATENGIDAINRLITERNNRTRATTNNIADLVEECVRLDCLVNGDEWGGLVRGIIKKDIFFNVLAKQGNTKKTSIVSKDAPKNIPRMH